MSAGSAPIDINGLMCVTLDSVERLTPQPSTSSSGLSMEPAVSPPCVSEVRLTADCGCRIKRKCSYRTQSMHVSPDKPSVVHASITQRHDVLLGRLCLHKILGWSSLSYSYAGICSCVVWHSRLITRSFNLYVHPLHAMIAAVRSDQVAGGSYSITRQWPAFYVISYIR